MLVSVEAILIGLSKAPKILIRKPQKWRHTLLGPEKSKAIILKIFNIFLGALQKLEKISVTKGHFVGGLLILEFLIFVQWNALWKTDLKA